jgi:hypothetical protein
MRLKFSALWLLLLLLLLLAFRHPLELRLLRHTSAARPDTSREPDQRKTDEKPFEFRSGGRRFRIVPRYSWDEAARVVSEKAYHFGEAASLIPEDYALAWGPVLEAPYASRIHFSQIGRFYMWGTSDSSLDRRTIVSHTANTHLIPASSRLRRAAACVGRGDEVRLEGWLVDVEGIDDPAFRWKTSTTREDEGPGGCETVFVTRLTINERVYE